MSNSKNLLFLFFIATTQVSAFGRPSWVCHFDPSNQCCIVATTWTVFGGEKLADQNKPKACCSTLGNKTQPSGIEGVDCNPDGKVTRINWSNKNLTGYIPTTIGKLVNLNVL
jgi:hypothetical protein